MNILRITQDALDDDQYRVEISFEGEGIARQAFAATFSFALTPQDDGDLRWYLEDYLEWPHDPAPKIAARVEARIKEIGTELFRAIFQSGDDARDLWATLRAKLSDTRVEIVTGVFEATSIPWELLRDPKTDSSLALRCRVFVRTQPDAVQSPALPDSAPEAIRILLVICRPGGVADVPFRSVAARILKSLNAAAHETFDLDVLRPPTFESLAKALGRAYSAGRPYHVVHFDGHGAYTDLELLFEAWKESEEEGRRHLQGVLRVDARRFSPQMLYPHPPRPGAHGFLVFENSTSDNNQRFVDGQELGKLLVETGVPVLVLNACRSAHADVRKKPEVAVETDIHEQRRAWGSLAQEVMDAGVAGVVAMRYKVYVVTAAQFVAELYASLVRGHTLGKAVALGRKQLHANPHREVVADPLPLQDWQVPIVYEAAPIALFSKPEGDGKLEISVGNTSIASAGSLDPTLPPEPDAGFYGRDETLLALDRAFDDQPIVLLHAYAGSGKTATAAEFARWYALTGGVEGPVFFTSFEYHMPLPRVLDRFGEVFGHMLERSGVQWLAITDEAERRRITLQVLEQVPVLWIWDNVEPVTGFPTGSESTWTNAEQRELADFLRACRKTKAHFLLTSRRDEKTWLGDLPARIQVPPMPMTERLQLARALAAKHRRRAEVMKDWRPLLEFSDGNPLTLTVLVGQALRDGLIGRASVLAYVDRLRAGEATFDDEASEGRSRSLGASLEYGFEHAFNEEQRIRLALLHLFQGFVDVTAFVLMGAPKAAWCVPEVRGLRRDDAIALFDRAAAVGLLTRYGSGYYSIHPALPWFLKSLFESSYGTTKQAVVRAFVQSMGELSNYYFEQYESGNRDVVSLLRAEEANLLQAHRLARVHGWQIQALAAMQGLRRFYGQTGRVALWRRLVEEIVPDFVDPETEGPLPGREDFWTLVTQYRIELAQEERNWDRAGRLLRKLIDWTRERAAPILGLSPVLLDNSQRHSIRVLAVSLEGLGNLQRDQGHGDCIATYREAIELSESIDDRTQVAVCAFNLGRAYGEIPAVRDLRKAKEWYRRSLGLMKEHDGLGRGRCLNELGFVALESFREAREQELPQAEILHHLNEAASFYHQALAGFPVDAVDEIAVAHNQLGEIYRSAGDTDLALPHLQKAIRYREKQGNVYEASTARFNVALTLAASGQTRAALEYARTALRGYMSYGDPTMSMIQRTRQLIDAIEQLA